ncbi:hypothetical protein [Streptomyces sp. JH14]|nr:hypothetical protein [Streptomyces sp. JH14]
MVEGRELFAVTVAQVDEDQDLEAQADGGGVEGGVVAADHAGA